MSQTTQKRFRTIDGESLMSCPLQPLSFVVDSLLATGLHVLAGSPRWVNPGWRCGSLSWWRTGNLSGA